MQRVIATALAPAVMLICGWWTLRQQGYILVDDAYISFRYALNFAEGHGLVWNHGDPVEGYTSLLWVLLLSPFAWLSLELVWPAVILSSLAGCGSLEVLRRIARRAMPARSPLLHGLPGLLLATNPSFVYWSASGMESLLFVFWVLLAVMLMTRLRSSRRQRILFGISLAAAYLTRPEGLAVAAMLLGLEPLLSGGSLRERLSPLIVPAALFTAVALVHIGWRLNFYGYPLPNTYYAKVILGSATTFERGIAHLKAFLGAGGFIVIPGVIALFIRGPGRRTLLQGYALLAIFGAYLLAVGGDIPRWFRFYLHLLPLPLIGLAELVGMVGDRAGRWLRRAAPGRGIVLGVTLSLFTSAQLLSWSRAEQSTVDEARTAGQVISWLTTAFLRQQVPSESFIAVSSVGGLGYYNRYRILDTWGLNDRHIAHTQVAPVGLDKFGHDKADWLYVLSTIPDYIISFGVFELPGYDVCWPTHLLRPLLILRRNFPLKQEQTTLGMPEGLRRTLLLPPPCAMPKGFKAPPVQKR